MIAIPKSNAGEDLFRFQAKALGLPPFEEQYLFAQSMGRQFRSDFCFIEYKLLVEINGGIFMKRGAHAMPTKILGDMERHQYAARLGYFVLPFSPDEVRNGHAIAWTQETLRMHGWRP